MKPTLTTPRPSFVSAHSLPIGIAAVAVPIGLILGGLSLFQPPARTVPEAAGVASLHHVVVDGAAASRLAAEHPWTSGNVSPADGAPAQTHQVVVDGAAASQLAAAHPWATSTLVPAGDALAYPRFVSVDGATASRLAAMHPWTTENSRQVYDATGAVRATIRTIVKAPAWPHYAFVQVDGALASRLAAEHPWTGEVATIAAPAPRP